MIANFRDEWLRGFFVEGRQSRHISVDLESRLFHKLQMIDDATCDQDLRVPPSNHFEKLRGNLVASNRSASTKPVAAGLPAGWRPRGGGGRLSR